MALTPVEEFMLNLERERYSRFRKPAEAKEKIVFVPAKVDKKAQKRRDQIMFHAGRYAAGARDEEATTANQQVGKIIQKGNK